MQEASSEYLGVRVVKQLVSGGAGSKQWVLEARIGYLDVLEASLEVQEVSSVYLEVSEAYLEV